MPNLYEPEDFIYDKVPIKVYLHHLEGANIYTILHWHQNIEFAVTTKGRILSTIGKESEIVGEGQFTLTNSGLLHTNHWVSLEDVYEGTVVQIAKNFVEQWLGENIVIHYPESEEGKRGVRDAILAIGEAYRDQADDLRQMELIFHLLNQVKAHCRILPLETGRSEKTVKRVKEVLIYVDQHYMEDIDLDMLAKSLHYTSEHLSRVFRESTGFTLHSYLQNTRLHHCLDQMQKDPGVKLLDLAMENGFPNSKSFIQVFKKTFDMTPSEWIRQRKLS